MTLRTPRRRISPRARRRCLAIRNFFHKTFNSLTSPSGIRINSSIAVNVTDLKRKATLNEHQVNAGSHEYRDLKLGHLSKRETASSTPTARQAISTSENRRRRLWDGDLEQAETKVLYKTTENLCTDSYDLVQNSNNELSDRPQHSSGRMNYEEYTSSPYVPKRRLQRNDYESSRDLNRLRSRLGNHETYFIIEKASSGLGSHDESHAQQVRQSDTVEDLISPSSSRHQFEYSRYLPPDDVVVVEDRKKRRKNKIKHHKSRNPSRLEDVRRKNKKNKVPSDEFITDVINQQYNPLNLLDRKASNFSRISAPVCRDYRYSARDMVMADSDMYTCSRAPTAAHRYPCAAGVSAMRSVCDTRLYSSHRPPRLRHRRRQANDYNDSSLYDVVPVKEKSSPKSRRKFIENMALTEVPPSPRTLRHRFNLETQRYSDCEDHERRASQSRRKPSPKPHRHPEYIETFRHDLTSENFRENRNNRSSPKMTRRTKNTAMTNDQQYLEYPNEVPPSPRTRRPCLNLETQNYSDYEDYYEQRPSQSRRKQSPYRPKRPEHFETFRDGMLSDSPRHRINAITPKLVPRTKYTTRMQDDMDPISSQQDGAFRNNIINANDNGKTQDGDSPLEEDKTDKALCEIKNILATFLQEIKKDSSTSQSDEASGTSNKNGGKLLEGSPRGSGNGTSNAMKNSTESSFNSGLVQGGMPAMPPQFMASYANPYCYQPVMPMCATHPVPCLHSTCVPSCMCVGAACGHNHQATDGPDAQYRCSRVNCTAEADATKKENVTDELIREIYNYVSQNPSITRRVPSKNVLNQERAARFPVSGSKSMHGLRQDAQVGTPLLRCHSKSCEAITSRQLFDTYYPANPCYSDSVISRETMDMPYNIPYERSENKFVEKKTPKQPPKQHSQNSKFVDALRLILKNKKDKKEHIHEVCQSEQSIEVDVLPKRRPNFQQDYLAYAMHGQEYLHPPPQHHPRARPRFEYNYPPCDPLMAEYSSAGPVSERHPYYDYIAAQSAPMYEAQDMQPQIPLCLKEVEVRSIGTQSERKAPYFKLFSPMKKIPQSPLPERSPVSILRGDRRNTSNTSDFSETKPRKLFNLNPKVAASKTEPSLYDKIQKDLNKEAKVNHALIKKLFYKRNPFSPQNRFVRTIMEKDTPVYKWRPRFFV